MGEIERLKIKCNSYAKRLVLEGYDDVVWEVVEHATSDNSEYLPPSAKSCPRCKIGIMLKSNDGWYCGSCGYYNSRA